MPTSRPHDLAACFDALRAPVRRYLATRPGADDRDLDDLVQATLLAAWQSVGELHDVSALRSWVFGIAANVARHHARGESRRRDAMRAYAAHPRAGTAPPDAVADSRRCLRRVPRALQTLPDELRIAYVLCAIEDVSGRDASRMLKLPEGTVTRRLCEARRALASAVGRSPA